MRTRWNQKSVFCGLRRAKKLHKTGRLPSSMVIFQSSGRQSFAFAVSSSWNRGLSMAGSLVSFGGPRLSVTSAETLSSTAASKGASPPPLSPRIAASSNLSLTLPIWYFGSASLFQTWPPLLRRIFPKSRGGALFYCARSSLKIATVLHKP